VITATQYFFQAGRYLAIALIPALLIIVVIKLFQKARHGLSSRDVHQYPYITVLIRIWYILFVLLVVFADRPNVFVQSVNFSIFSSYREALVAFSAKSVLNIVLNILLFVPIGFLFSSSFKNRNRSWLVLPIGLIFIIIIESIQLYFSVGVMDIDDIINNFLGVIIGHASYKLLYIYKFRMEIKMNKQAVLYGILLALPMLIFGGVYVGYLLQDYGNLRYEYYYGQRLSKCNISFEDNSLSLIDNEIKVFKIKRGTAKDAFVKANSLFSSFDTRIGDDISYYDDCVVIYNVEHNLCLWYYYDTATYYLNDFSRIALDDSKAINITSNDVARALNSLNINVPQNSYFSFIGDGQFEFSLNLRTASSELLAGSITCVYYDAKAHMIKYDILKLTEVASLEKTTKENLSQRILSGDFYLTDDSLYKIEKIDSISVRDISIVYTIDTKGFYHPMYRLNTVINDAVVILYISV